MTAAKIEALTIEQDEIMIAIANMKRNAHMFSSGTELFRSFQRLQARFAEIARLLD